MLLEPSPLRLLLVCCWRSTGEKKKPRSLAVSPRNSRAFGWSGRQDLNLRPLGPEQRPGASEGGSRGAFILSNPLESFSSPGATREPLVHGFAPVCTNSATRALPVGEPNGSEVPPRLEGPHGARLLTVEEVARYLGVSRATVYKLCSEGRLPHLRVSNAIRFRPSDIGALLQQG
ncbi:helix-turn-helix domain-containing protein [Hyalangium sp.]|uniref:helix-turn-helix domain-containing protein n=1 Tax=Hyalangium sp. TaxID=2028555 RepID=UPI0039C86B12